jgi:hypothetical protein
VRFRGRRRERARDRRDRKEGSKGSLHFWVTPGDGALGRGAGFLGNFSTLALDFRLRLSKTPKRSIPGKHSRPRDLKSDAFQARAMNGVPENAISRDVMRDLM